MPVAKQNTPDNYVFGRPAKYDLKYLADHLLEWVKDERNWDLCKWVDEVEADPNYPHQWADTDEYFGRAWARAKNRIAARRTEMHAINEIPLSIYSKYQHNYDVMHHAFEEKMRDREAKRKKESESSSSGPITLHIVDYTKAECNPKQ